jgi:hypothetical protein
MESGHRGFSFCIQRKTALIGNSGKKIDGKALTCALHVSFQVAVQLHRCVININSFRPDSFVTLLANKRDVRRQTFTR